MDYPVWHITHKEGANTLVGSDCAGLELEATKVLKSKPKPKPQSQSQSQSQPSVPLWDGQTAERIIAIIST